MCLEYDHIDQGSLLKREKEKQILYVYILHIMNDGSFVLCFILKTTSKKGQEYVQ